MQEDFGGIEAAILAEIRQALDVKRPKPPMTITIPQEIQSAYRCRSKGNDSSVDKTASTEVDSLDGPDQVTFTNVEEAAATREFDPGAYHNDSLMGRLSHMSMGSSGPHSNNSSPRFYIGTVEEEGSIQSKVSRLEADEMSYGELMGVVERLYEHLKQSDAALATEKSRRASREKSLIKLATELAIRKDTICKQMGHIEELREELRMILAEKSLLEQRLEHQLHVSQEDTDESRHDLEQALARASELYDNTVTGHELRMSEMNKSHAHQCEQLCREVVQADQETARLENKLAELSKGALGYETSVATIGSFDSLPPEALPRKKNSKRALRYKTSVATIGSFDSLPPKASPRKKKSRRGALHMNMATFVLICVMYAVFKWKCFPADISIIGITPLNRHSATNFRPLKALSPLVRFHFSDTENIMGSEAFASFRQFPSGGTDELAIESEAKSPEGGRRNPPGKKQTIIVWFRIRVEALRNLLKKLVVKPFQARQHKIRAANDNAVEQDVLVD